MFPALRIGCRGGLNVKKKKKPIKNKKVKHLKLPCWACQDQMRHQRPMHHSLQLLLDELIWEHIGTGPCPSPDPQRKSDQRHRIELLAASATNNTSGRNMS